MKVELTEILLTVFKESIVFSVETAAINLSILNKPAEFYILKQDLVFSI